MSDWTDNYDPFAEVYDRFWARDSSIRFEEVLDEAVLRTLDDGDPIIDLCCGTGRLARRLCARGFDVVGIDNSPEMIARARRHAPEASFFVADARQFEVDRPARLVISTYDSLNHLPSLEDLEDVFERVFAAVEPSGHFAFDLNTPEKYENRWSGTFVIEDVDAFVTVEPTYHSEDREARFRVTSFGLEDDELWQRNDYVLRQRAYEQNEVVGALTSAGFDDVEVRAIEEEDEMQLRWLFRCRRP